jgi:NADPH-dependent 2,4-dienoyl-CoA reductase/sulfur reductase-like enzyme
MNKFELVIAGGGLAAARAIKSYREAGGHGAVALVSQENTLPYHRPPLSKGFLQGAVAGDALVEQEAFYAEHGVEVLLGTSVGAVSPDERTVTAGGKRYRYDSLLLTTGARPRRLDVPGADLNGVFSLRTNHDAAAIRDAAGRAREALVVGGGFIGLEVASSLRQLGLEVTLVHRDAGLFQLLGAPELEHDLADLVRTNGVELILGDEVARFDGRAGHVDSAFTGIGRTLATELVVVGVGVEPAVDYLAGSGIEVANGIVVDDRFETSVPGIYAAGDVASFHDPLYGRRRRLEHWSNADYAGTRVGRILAGQDDPYETVSSFFTQAFGVTIKVLGDHTVNDRLVMHGSLREREMVGLYFDGEHLVGGLLVGQTAETEASLRLQIEQGGRVAPPPVEERLARVAA